MTAPVASAHIRLDDANADGDVEIWLLPDLVSITFAGSSIDLVGPDAAKRAELLLNRLKYQLEDQVEVNEDRT